MSCGVGCSHGSDPVLLWLWCRLAATALIRPLAWEPPYALGAALQKAKTHTQKNNNNVIQAGIDAIEYSKGSIELTTWIEKNGDTFARAWLDGYEIN